MLRRAQHEGLTLSVSKGEAQFPDLQKPGLGTRRVGDPDLVPARRRALLIVPGLAFIAILFLYPLAALVGSSFQDDAGFTLAHYARIIEIPVYTRVLIKTVWVSAAVTAICLVIGYPLAYALAQAQGFLKGVLLVAILMPFWTNLLVRAYGWIVTLHETGLVNSVLRTIGVVDEPLALVFNTTGVLIGMGQIMLPYMVLPLAAVMERMDYSLMHAARSLGASPARAFAHVFLPLTLPGVFAGCLLVFVLCLGFFVIPALLGGRRDILIAQLVHFNLTTTLNWGFAAALSSVLLVTTLVIYALGQRWFKLNLLWGEGK